MVNFKEPVDLNQGGRVVADRMFDLHCLGKSRKVSKLFEKCGICNKHMTWPWTTVYKCDTCKIVCHKRCARKVFQICTLVSIRGEDGPKLVSRSKSIVDASENEPAHKSMTRALIQAKQIVDNVTGSNTKLSKLFIEHSKSIKAYRCPKDDSTTTEEVFRFLDSVSSGSIADAQASNNGTTARERLAPSVTISELIYLTTIARTKDDVYSSADPEDSVLVILPSQDDSAVVVLPCQEDSSTVVRSDQSDSSIVITLSPGDSSLVISPSSEDSNFIILPGPGNSSAALLPVQEDFGAGSHSKTWAGVLSIGLMYPKFAEFLRPCLGHFGQEDLCEYVFQRTRRRKSVPSSIVIRNGRFVRCYTDIHLSMHAKIKVTPLSAISSSLEKPSLEVDKVDDTKSSMQSNEVVNKPNDDD